MAMNKKEQAEFAALKEEVCIARALRFTDPVSPDVAPPKFGRLSTGFLFAGTRGVEVACSSSTGHAYGRDDKTTTQNPRWLYSTKLLALRAMRHEREIICARELARIDKEIEEEIEWVASVNKEQSK